MDLDTRSPRLSGCYTVPTNLSPTLPVAANNFINVAQFPGPAVRSSTLIRDVVDCVVAARPAKRTLAESPEVTGQRREEDQPAVGEPISADRNGSSEPGSRDNGKDDLSDQMPPLHRCGDRLYTFWAGDWGKVDRHRL